MFVELFIEHGGIDFHVGVGGVQGVEAFGGGKDGDNGDAFDAALGFEQFDGVGKGAAGGQHGVEQEGAHGGGVRGQAEIVFHGLQGVFVAVHADMADFGGGDEIEDSADHAEAGAENGDEQDLFGQLQGVAGGEGGVDADGPQGEIAGDFIDQQVGEFLQRGAEQLVVGLAVAENGELVLDQGVFQNSDSGAHGAVPPIGSET